MTLKVAIASAVAVCALSAPVFAAGTLEERMAICTRIGDNTERLVCFDREMRERQSPSARQPQLPPADAPKAGGAGSATPAPAAPARADSRPMPAPAPEPESFTAKVVSVTRPSGREMRIELDNGEVWRENDRSTELEVNPGDEVRIRPAALGSFMLRAPSGRSTRVHREK